MQLNIKISLNNSEPGRYGENEVSRNFAIEIPGTSEDQVNEAKLINAANGLASYEDVIASLVNELNEKLEAEKPVGPEAPPEDSADNGTSESQFDKATPPNPFANDEEVPQ